ncbi:hypothetical protein MVEN_00235000 [Mycena venus]|uniref:Uncharacterized protein n=1 Tax=Mycena venus TaxID=2733690 RepID=A0A8H6Z4D2_9AGAR|nr:hypothetical protein MVEN_00235000 [Mycena venus]
MTIQLAQELVDAIVDYLKADYGSLRAGSLVARAWVPRCRFHLFKTCLLNSTNIPVFCELLRSPNCTFLQHVCSVDAARTDSHQNSLYFDEIAPDLRHLAHVRTLTYHMVVRRPENADDFFRRGFVAAFPHITHLDLICECPSWPAPLIEMVCLFPALQILRITSISSALADPPASASPPRGLKSLRLSRGALGPIFTWLQAFDHSVDSLVLPLPRPSDAPVVRAVLQRLGDGLHHLSMVLNWSRPRSEVEPSAVFDFALHPNLGTLAIHDVSWAQSPEHFDPNRMVHFLMRLAAPTLESLSLNIPLYLYRNLDWAPLDAFLSSARFPRLRQVTFSMSCDRDDIKFLREAMPTLQTLGVLAMKS